jgi:hypothetical protein
VLRSKLRDRGGKVLQFSQFSLFHFFFRAMVFRVGFFPSSLGMSWGLCTGATELGFDQRRRGERDIAPAPKEELKKERKRETPQRSVSGFRTGRILLLLLLLLSRTGFFVVRWWGCIYEWKESKSSFNSVSRLVALAPVVKRHVRSRLLMAGTWKGSRR